MSQHVRCNLCGSDAHRSFPNAAGSTKIVRCEVCGLVFTNPQPSPQELERQLSRRFSLEDEVLEYQRDKSGMLLRELERLGGPGKILDVGCGWGTFLSVARERGWDGAGVEVRDFIADYARDRVGVPVFYGELRDAGFPDEHFDAVTLWEVLEHVSDPSGLLREVHRILKLDGILGLLVPNVESHSARTKEEWWAPFHLFHFSNATLRGMVERAGFTVVREIVNPHVEAGQDCRARRVVLKRLAWFVRGMRGMLGHPILSRCLSSGCRRAGSITLYARKGA